MTARSSAKSRRGAFQYVPPCGLWWGTVLFVYVLGLAAAHAQLGATPGIMEKTYGPVFRHGARIWHGVMYDTGPADGDIYRKDDLFIRAAFRGGTVELLEYSTANRVLTQQEVDKLLAANEAGTHWLLGADSTDTAKYYRRTDGGAIAQWAVGVNGSLLVSAEKLKSVEDRMIQQPIDP